MLEQLHQFEPDEWKRIESQFVDHYTATYNFVTENRGSVQEARNVYMEAFVYYIQLLELQGMKLVEKAPDILYSFSRKLWLLKLEKRNVDLNYVKHRREYFEMEEAFHSIDSINQRSTKTADKLAQIGEPHRTILLECVGRKKAICDIAPRFGFSDEDRAFQQLSKNAKQLIKLIEGKDVEENDAKFASLFRFVLDNPQAEVSTIQEADKVTVTMISRLVVMVRSHVTRASRVEHLRAMQEKQLEPKTTALQTEKETNTKKMKPVLVFSITAFIAVAISAITSVSLSGGTFGAGPAAALESESTELVLEDVVEVAPVLEPSFVSNAFAVAPEGYFITTAAEISSANSIQLIHAESGEGFNASVVYNDTLNNLAILHCTDETKPFNVPFRFNPLKVALGEQVYSISYPEAQLLYSDGSISFTDNEGTIGARIGYVAAGTPVLAPNGQLNGMTTTSENGMATLIEATKLNEIFAKAQQTGSFKMNLPQRNKLFFMERAQQIETMKKCIYKVKVFY